MDRTFLGNDGPTERREPEVEGHMAAGQEPADMVGAFGPETEGHALIPPTEGAEGQDEGGEVQGHALITPTMGGADEPNETGPKTGL